MNGQMGSVIFTPLYFHFQSYILRHYSGMNDVHGSLTINHDRWRRRRQPPPHSIRLIKGRFFIQSNYANHLFTFTLLNSLACFSYTYIGWFKQCYQKKMKKVFFAIDAFLSKYNVINAIISLAYFQYD